MNDFVKIPELVNLLDLANKENQENKRKAVYNNSAQLKLVGFMLAKLSKAGKGREDETENARLLYEQLTEPIPN